jgi:hypothetical protein
MSPRAAFLQLPVPDTDPRTARANVPLAAGCVAAAAVASGAVRREDVRIAPRRLVDRGGDAAVAEWIASGMFDVVGFTAYQWNLERSLAVARALKERSPGTLTVMGGPEIAPGMPVLHAPQVDVFAVGEGETMIPGILRGAARRSPRPPARRVRIAPRLADLASTRNPYLEDILPAEPGEPMYLETMRGCPHRCSYCRYGKAFPVIRRFPAAVIPEAFRLAEKRGMAEIYLMDPTFNASPRWETVLEAVVAANTARLPLHTELRLEAVTAKRADLLRKAGFRSVEAGLQSVNLRALAAVGRRWDRRAFERGARLLLRRGIEVRTGVILGLPEDTAEGFRATVRYLSDLGLLRHAEIYPLSVLPGTRLREEAGRRGISFMSAPPYWVLATPTMGEQEVVDAVRDAERDSGLDLFQPVLPRFVNGDDGFLGFADLRRVGLSSLRAEAPGRIGASLTVLVRREQLAARSDWRALGAWLRRHNPSTLVQIVVDSAAPPDPRCLDEAAEAIHDPASYFDRIHYLKHDAQGRFSVRMFHLLPDLRAGRRRGIGEGPCDPILRCTPALLSGGRDLLRDRPFVLLGKGSRPGDRDALRPLYRGWEHLLLEAPGI